MRRAEKRPVAGVYGSLEPEYRALAAWIFRHRFQRPDDAKTFFRTAIDDSPPNSSLRGLAKAALGP